MPPNTNERLAVLETKVTNIENGMTNIETKLDTFHDSFATKEDHRQNVTKIDSLDKSISGINIKIALATGGFSTIIFIIEKLWK